MFGEAQRAVPSQDSTPGRAAAGLRKMGTILEGAAVQRHERAQSTAQPTRAATTAIEKADGAGRSPYVFGRRHGAGQRAAP